MRHRRPDAESPLSVGNGNFAVTVDCTGLQTFAEQHTRAAARSAERSAMVLGTQSSWAFHWAPNPAGHELSDTEREYRRPDGRAVHYPVAYDWRLSDADARRDDPAGFYFWTNPQRLHLGRVGYVLTSPRDGVRVEGADALTDIDQTLDLWSGSIRSSFRVDGIAVETETRVHPARDLLAVQATSPLFASGHARIRIAFSAIDDTFEAEERRDDAAHVTEIERVDARTTIIRRRVDDARYVVHIVAEDAEVQQGGPHDVDIVPRGEDLRVSVEFTREEAVPLPPLDDTTAAANAHWERFWTTGAAVDFRGSTDPRADELERRVVLSQYLTAIHCSGDLPPQESGLVCNSWAGKFHLEMHWWHAAHFPMWGRPELLERSLSWYLDSLPEARAAAQRNGYRGARWPKHVGPEAVESPNDIGPLLVWQQPHPIHFAELVHHASADRERVLARYGELVDETAEYLVSLLWWKDGVAHLAPPVMPAQERYDAATTWDPTFELAYVQWALTTAISWRERRGVGVPEEWRRTAAGIAPLPTSSDGRYEAVAGHSEVIDHPSLLGALGFVPATPLVDRQVMARTLDWVLEEWAWDTTWGWDFPLIAMCAHELGRDELALDMLLRDHPRNHYLANGHNMQVPNRLPLYLPGNGGLLAAIAMLVTGKDGASVELPAGWTVVAEGFSSRP